LCVTSPLGTGILREGIPFVRFESDANRHSDSLVQLIALHRILRADFVYVVAPEGYIGRTTCYEIGRILQARRPLYFSEQPRDLPIHIPETHVLPLSTICHLLAEHIFHPAPLYDEADGNTAKLDSSLIDGIYLSEEELGEI